MDRCPRHETYRMLCRECRTARRNSRQDRRFTADSAAEPPDTVMVTAADAVFVDVGFPDDVAGSGDEDRPWEQGGEPPAGVELPAADSGHGSGEPSQVGEAANRSSGSDTGAWATEPSPPPVPDPPSYSPPSYSPPPVPDPPSYSGGGHSGWSSGDSSGGASGGGSGWSSTDSSGGSFGGGDSSSSSFSSDGGFSAF